MAYNYNYFTIEPASYSASVAGIKVNTKYPKIKPSGLGGGYIDVLNHHRWKNSGFISEVPSVFLKEYELSFGKWTSNVLASLNNIANVTSIDQNSPYNDPYGFLYVGEPTKFSYLLPQLIKPGSTLKGKTVNRWKDQSALLKNSSFLQKVSKGLEIAGSILSPGLGTEKVMEFAGTNPKSITIEFPLYNTFDIQGAVDNFSFVSLFGIQNLKTRTSFLTYIPPKIYSVESTSWGGVFMPAAYVSEFDVVSIGTTRAISWRDIKLTGGLLNGSTVAATADSILLPEAYKVKITLTELIPESSNIMGGALGMDNKLNLIKDPSQVPASANPEPQQSNATPFAPPA
jgi:hypothetical protein